MNPDTPVVILCGGKGTRIREASESLPKAMVEIGGRPIAWHIMKSYREAGYRRFILCLGYKSWAIKEYFLDYRARSADFTLSMAEKHRIDFHDTSVGEDFEITFAETGLETATGSRVRMIKQYVDTENFFLTYGDGVGTVDINKLAAEHEASGKVGTVTGVHPTSKFGEMQVEGNRVVEFNEKPTQVTGFVSGGFFAFKKEFLDSYLGADGDADVWLEHEPLQKLARDGELNVHRHEGFWSAMDTFKDYEYLNGLWAKDKAPWKTWA
ncbi:glucose-1-phosphate cytidylyltransferase [Pseudonocardia nematodicida]|uniref:Glucose-1-phosphate cytidylyltransferase n=1 Tax=Pseudonocardia nematodicida TaxID=1206997 RepID=A0ABV1K4K3_9PSEU